MNKSFLSRKETIVLSAIDIISELGLHNLSTRELAKREGITEPALYRQFKSRSEIVLAVLEYYSSFDLVIANTIKNNHYSSKDAILFAVKFLAEYYENYPAITAITQSYEILLHEPSTEKKIKEIFYRRELLFKKVIEEGQANGEFRAGFESGALTDIILGTFRSILLRWRMEKYQFCLKEQVLNAIERLVQVC